MNKKIILVHGYYKNSKDMLALKKNLEGLGNEITLVDLPLTFEDIVHATSIFQRIIGKIINDLEKGEKISLVGHSTGGLVIRLFLSNTKHIDKINRCVLIATPNKGSQLAEIAWKLAPAFTNKFKTLKSLNRGNIESLKLKHMDNIEIGAIAGNKCNSFLGKLLKNENDGRVQVNSAIYEGVKDSIVLPCGHKEIHHRLETAKLIDSFLKQGRFNKDN